MFSHLIFSCLHLTQKHARIFVRGHYLFREANNFPRAHLEENWALRNRLKARKNILEYFRAKWRLLFQIAKFMYCYHNSLLPPLFLNLFPTSSQIHVCSTRTANNHRAYYCRTNLSKIKFFTKIQRSGNPFLVQSLLWQVFPILRNWPRLTVGQQTADSRPTVGQQVLRGALPHNYRKVNARVTEHKRDTINGDANNHIAVHHELTNHIIDWEVLWSVLNLQYKLFPTTDSGKLVH